MTTDKPRYEHDCNACTFLGQYEDYDLYFCLRGGNRPTVIYRYGDEGSQYSSGLELADLSPQLGEARKRAIEAGLLTAEQTNTRS
jgi:hypothetical protein